MASAGEYNISFQQQVSFAGYSYAYGPKLPELSPKFPENWFKAPVGI
jgi:hypothetical protein